METIFTTLFLISVTITFIFVVVFLPVYLRSSISSMVDENEELRRKYLLATRDIYNIHKNVQQALQHWPIWPRPVLYTDLDYKIQHMFAQLTGIFSQLESGEYDIDNISQEWFHNLKFKKFPWREYLQIHQILALHRERIERLIGSLAQAREFSTAIADCQSKVAQREKAVKEELAIWQKRSLEYKGGIVSGGKEETPEYIRIVHVLEDIHSAVEEGLTCSRQKPSPDGLPLARVDICNKTAREAWRQFELDALILQVEDNFEIDKSGVILEKTEPALRLISVNVHNDLWDGLRGLKREIQRVRNEIMTADLYFRKFREDVGQLKEYLSKLEGIRPAVLLESAGRQEAKLNKLWYEYPEWERVLGGRQEPSKRLEDAKLKWELYLQPAVDGTELIKQSMVQNLVSQIENFLILVEEMQNDVKLISIEISEQEDAKEKIKTKLIPTSVLSSSLAQLLGVKNDTSDDISIRTTSYDAYYQAYRSKLDALNGPNYKKLEKDVSFFEREVAETLMAHTTLISERWSIAQRVRSELVATYEKLLSHQKAPLGFNYKWNEIKRSYLKHEQAYSLFNETKSFRKLQEFSESARINQVDWGFLAKAADERLKSFQQDVGLEYSKILSREQRASETLDLLNNLKWANLFQDYGRLISETRIRFQTLRKELRSLMAEAWIDDATRKLNEFPGRINLVEKDMSSAFQEAQRIDRDIERKYQAVVARVPLDYRDEISSRLFRKLKSCQSPAQAYDEIDVVKRLRAERDLYLFIRGDVSDSNINIGGRNVRQTRV